MEEDLYPTPDFVNTVISTGNIELLESLYKLGLSSKHGKNIVDAIEARLGEISTINNYPLRFRNFSQLVKFYHAVKKLGRLPFEMSNGYIVIARNQKIFYTLDEFMDILRRSPVRGMRVIFEVKDEGIAFTEPYWWTDEKVRLFSVRKTNNGLHFTTHLAEFYGDCRYEGDIGKMLQLTQSDYNFQVSATYDNFRTELGTELETVEKFFDRGFKPIDSRIRFVSNVNAYELAVESMDEGFTIVFLPNLQDDGEYSRMEDIEYPYMLKSLNDANKMEVYKYNSQLTDKDGWPMYYMSETRYIETIIGGDSIKLTLINFKSYVNKTAPEAEDADLEKYELFESGFPRSEYLKLKNANEKCSFIKYFESRSLFDEYLEDAIEMYAVMGVYTDTINFNTVSSYHACVDTKTSTLCLITEESTNSTSEFEIIESRVMEFNDTRIYINTIELI